MNYVLDNENKKFYLDLLYVVEEYITFKIYIKIGAYSGEGIMTFNYNEVQEQIQNLDILWEGKRADFRMNDYDSAMYIAIKPYKDNYYLLYGQLADGSDNLELRYNVKIDQSSIRLLRDVLCDSSAMFG